MVPKRISNFLKSFEENIESLHEDYYFILNDNFLVRRKENENKLDFTNLLKGLEMEKIETCFVKHCHGAFGISLTHLDGWKLTYSGDTMPCNSLIELGMESDLLIHEATMEDGMEKEAELKTHSTVSQAIEIGESMKAKNIILTHFSQRYARLPMLGKHTTSKIGVAFDNMLVSLNDIQKLHYLYPSLLLMFAEDYERTVIKMNKKTENENIQKNVITLVNN